MKAAFMKSQKVSGMKFNYTEFPRTPGAITSVEDTYVNHCFTSVSDLEKAHGSSSPDYIPPNKVRRLDPIICSYCRRNTYRFNESCEGCGAPLGKCPSTL